MRVAPVCALALAILSTPACYSSKVVPMDDALASHHVWVTLADRSVVLLDDPKIYGNKLVGFVNGKYEEYLTDQVKETRVRQAAGGRTAALVAASVVGFAGFAFLITGAGKANKPDYCDAPEHVDEPICQGM